MENYFPEKESPWIRSNPADLGFDEQKIEEAVLFAKENESKMDRDIERALASGHFSEPLPLGKVIGPTKRREDPSGMILSRGRIIKQWGPVKRPEMTFSIAKSYLSLCAGAAFDQGLIADLNQKVSEAIEEEQFETEQNKEITWRHLLQQTSEWEGELWGKPDLIDRNRDLELPPNTPSLKGTY